MTKKDYIKIASTMNELLLNNAEPFGWMATVNALAAMLKKDNSNFDRHAFRNACGWVVCTGLSSEQV